MAAWITTSFLLHRSGRKMIVERAKYIVFKKDLKNGMEKTWRGRQPMSLLTSLMTSLMKGEYIENGIDLAQVLSG